MDDNWDNKLHEIWDSFGTMSDEMLIENIKLHIGNLNIQDNSIAKFELACAYDSTGNEALAEGLYRDALAIGLTGLRRRRARIQLASTLRNNGKIDESITILKEEKEKYSDELNDAVDGFLALSLAAKGFDKEALSIALKALSSHLKRYNKSLYTYANALNN